MRLDSPPAQLARAMNVKRLVEARRTAKNYNPIDRGVMASPPTVGTPTSAVSGSTPTAYSAIASPSVFTLNSRWTVSGSALGPTDGYGRISFITDAPLLSLRESANGAASHLTSIMVDGQYASLTSYNLNIAQSNAYTTLDFSSVRAFRRFDIEIVGFPNFYGVNLAATDTIYAPEAGPRVVVVGDSYTGQTGASRIGGGWANIMGLMSGWDVCWDTGAPGGSGYTAAGSSSTFINRLSAVTAQNPAAVIVAGGINDVGQSTGTIQAAALAYFQALRAALPLAPIVVLGAWPGSTGPNANTISAENAISAAFTQWGDPFSRLIPVSTAVKPVIFGTGRSGSTNGSGNSDFYIGGTDGTDVTHPTQAGHTYLGRWAAEQVQNALESLAATLT